MENKTRKLLFVYETDGGSTGPTVAASGLAQEAANTQCALGELTLPGGVESAAWRSLLAIWELEVELLHREAFLQAHPDNHDEFPAILIAEPDRLPETIIFARDLCLMVDEAELIEVLDEVLATRTGFGPNHKATG